MKKFFLLLCLLVSSNLIAQEQVQMKLENGVYTIPCTINGLKLRFIFDTGASNVFISATEASFMLKNHYLSIDDFQDVEKVLLADGSIVENAVVILKEVKVGSKVLTNVKASVSYNINAPLLLGQSAIGMLGKWHINDGALILEDSKILIPADIDAAVKQYEAKGDVASAYHLLKNAIIQDDYKSYERWFKFVWQNEDLLMTAQVEIDNDSLSQLFFEAIMVGYPPLVEFFKENPHYFFYGSSQKHYYYEALFKKGYQVAGKYLANLRLYDDSISFDSYVYYLESSAKLGDAESYYLLGNVYDPTAFYLNLPGRMTNVTKALYWYKKSADKSDPKGQYFYAKTLLECDSSTSDQKLVAIDYLKKSANSEYGDAIMLLVEEYLMGINVKRNYDSALFWAKKLENDWKSKWWACACIGFIYYDKGEKQAAATYLEKAVLVDKERDNMWTSIPQHTYGLLGEMYYFGDGVSRDDDKALKLLLKEIEKFDSKEIDYYSYVGNLYFIRGEYKKALTYLLHAAEHGDAYSQSLLPSFYVDEERGGLDYRKAEKFALDAINNEKSSNQTLSSAYGWLGFIYGEEYIYEETTTYKNSLYKIGQSTECYKKASSYGNGLASYVLGGRYEEGQDGVEKNFALAEKYYRLAVEQGYEKAKAKLSLFK